jgi:hypothetical protein
MVIFDGRADWFSIMWHVNRYYFYYKAPIVQFPDFLRLQQGNEDQFTYLARRGFRDFWFVQTMPEGIVGSPGSQEYQDSIATLVDLIERGGIKPLKEIRNGKGRLIFRIYRFSTAS